MSNPPRTAGEGTAARTSVLGLLIILSAQCLAQVQSPGTCSGKRGPVTQEHPPAARMPATPSDSPGQKVWRIQNSDKERFFAGRYGGSKGIPSQA